MHLVLVDALDSFTHNLAQAFAVLGARVTVLRADAPGRPDPDEILALAPALCVLGPGPGHPDAATAHHAATTALLGRVPLLGVCLGHQVIASALGGAIVRHPPVHGRATPIHHDGTGLFSGLPPAVAMGRYHSLGVDPDRLPASLRITAWSPDGVVMGIAHRTLPAWGVQFHPESVTSGAPGMALMHNFVALAGSRARRLAG